MKNLIAIIVIIFLATSCSSSPCNHKDGYTVKGCKEKGKNIVEAVKDGYTDLKDRVED